MLTRSLTASALIHASALAGLLVLAASIANVEPAPFRSSYVPAPARIEIAEFIVPAPEFEAIEEVVEQLVDVPVAPEAELAQTPEPEIAEPPVEEPPVEREPEPEIAQPEVAEPEIAQPVVAEVEPTTEPAIAPPLPELEPVTTDDASAIASADSEHATVPDDSLMASNTVGSDANPTHGNVGDPTDSPREDAVAPEPTVIAVGPDTDGLMRDYIGDVDRVVRRRVRYPREARGEGLEGVVVLEIVVDSRGRILSVVILESSGHPLLDDAAREMIDSLRSLPAPPTALAWDERAVQIPVDYRLN